MPPIEIFFSYSHKDEELMNQVRRQLIIYDRQQIIKKWHDRKILPGQEWEGVIDERINRAKIILLFVSPYFIESKYCYNTEMKVALDRHESGDAAVIPIILRPCPWKKSSLGKLQALPKDGKPLNDWRNRDKAALNVAEGLMEVVRELKGSVKTSRPAAKASKFTVKKTI
ncbi:MAG: toll/interleukin-1 receptor domain-containing protein [Anaerolineales bacterium]|nr:toll/interleukin-1 receptor domain-containing protein [Anaerolineales bacterium]